VNARFLLALVIGGALLSTPATAQYCANYSDGEKTCGIATLQMCEQSISGVGGYCGPDQSAQIPPNFMQRRRQQMDPNRPPFMGDRPLAPSEQAPGGLDWMPPPPSE
jgi:hypothetical protein